jgi:hypothetical protein
VSIEISPDRFGFQQLHYKLWGNFEVVVDLSGVKLGFKNCGVHLVADGSQFRGIDVLSQHASSPDEASH